MGIGSASALDAQAMQDQAHKLCEIFCCFPHAFSPLNLESTLKAKCSRSHHHCVMCQKTAAVNVLAGLRIFQFSFNYPSHFLIN